MTLTGTGRMRINVAEVARAMGYTSPPPMAMPICEYCGRPANGTHPLCAGCGAALPVPNPYRPKPPTKSKTERPVNIRRG